MPREKPIPEDIKKQVLEAFERIPYEYTAYNDYHEERIGRENLRFDCCGTCILATWVRAPNKALKKVLPNLSLRIIAQSLSELEDDGILVWNRHKRKLGTHKWWRVKCSYCTCNP